MSKNLEESQVGQEKNLEIDKTLLVGEISTITLDANRTTGYKWYCQIENEDIIEVFSDKYKKKESNGKVVGAGGKRIITLKGIKEGITSICFKYEREWEDKEPEKTKEILIEVKK